MSSSLFTANLRCYFLQMAVIAVLVVSHSAANLERDERILKLEETVESTRIELAEMRESAAEMTELIGSTRAILKSFMKAFSKTDYEDTDANKKAPETVEGSDSLEDVLIGITASGVITLLRGRDGRDGVDGANGVTGAPGAAGAPGFHGRDGAPGLPGEPGEDGSDGEPGEAGTPGTAGSPGPAGDTGTPGQDGIPGAAGGPGPAGDTGTPGQDGIPGSSGGRGIPGQAGIPGAAGAPGVQGDPGADGQNGTCPSTCNPDSGPALCTSPYIRIDVGSGQRKCVLVQSTHSNWTMAKDWCENAGAYLLTFGSKNSTIMFGNYLAGVMGHTADTFWIGGQKSYNQWYWVGILTGRVPADGSAESGWHNGHSASNEPPCLYYQTSSGNHYGWNAHGSCSSTRKFICEKPQ